MNIIQQIFPNTRNIILLGEAGCGKSELAINLSVQLAEANETVHLFDLDMTKPLFRARDEKDKLQNIGIHFHYEEQFQDAPTVVGGVVRQLNDNSAYTVLDVGGDYIGARAIGAYAPYLNRDNTAIIYLLNPYRPWSQKEKWIRHVMADILWTSRLDSKRVVYAVNPYLGPDTCKEDISKGWEHICQFIDADYISMLCVPAALADEAPELDVPIIPIKRYLAYPWESGAAE